MNNLDFQSKLIDFNLECGENEYYDPQGTCELQCGKAVKCPRSYPKPDCYCFPGYIRINGICRPKIECPPVCPENEYWDTWGVCDGNCTNPFAVCPRYPRPGCACLPGLVRNEYGKCIEPKDCPHCDDGEEWLEFGYCEGICGISLPQCNKDCLKRGCYCKKGYVRNSKGKCIPEWACPECMFKI